MKNIKISVIIPVYNVEKYIIECIESIINQTFKDIEIIVVNDGSKDNSIKIVEEYLSDKRLKIINKENRGLSSARNKGMKIARGEYIYFIDSDDFINEDVLEVLYKNLESERFDIIFSNFSFYNDKTKKEKKSKFNFPFKENINKNKIISLISYFIGAILAVTGGKLDLSTLSPIGILSVSYTHLTLPTNSLV